MSDDYFRQYRDSQSQLADARQDLRLAHSALHTEQVARERAEAEVRRLRRLLKELKAPEHVEPVPSDE